MAGCHHAILSGSRNEAAGLGLVGVGAAQSGANPTVPVPANYTLNDLLVIAGATNGTYSTPAGWTAALLNGGGMSLSVFYKWAAASESSVVVSTTGSSSLTVMACFRGWHTIDATGTATAGTGSVAAAGVTTTTTGDLMLSIFGSNANSTTWTAVPSGVSTAYDSAGLGSVRALLLCYESVPNAGATGTRSATNSNGATSVEGICVAFKP